MEQRYGGIALVCFCQQVFPTTQNQLMQFLRHFSDSSLYMLIQRLQPCRHHYIYPIKVTLHILLAVYLIIVIQY